MNTNGGKSLIALLSLGLALGGCAKQKDLISQVSNEAYLAKSELTGKTFSAVKTIVAADEKLDDAGIIPGFHMDMGFVQFVVTEKQLQVVRVGEPDKTSLTATVVASYPIISHFDIQRERNDFGEETNKIIEDKKKPWNERAYIRVDLGANAVSTTELSSVFATSVKEEVSKVVSPLKRDGKLLSYDVDATISQTDRFNYEEDQAQSYTYNSYRAHIKTTFLEVTPTDFKPYEMSNKEFARFGYFRTFENFLDPDKGATISSRKLYANKYNVCENNAKTAGLSCATNKIVYTLNAGFPEELKQSARDVIAAWNKSFQKALDRKDDIVVLDESVAPEIGDTRYNMIAGIDEKLPTGLLGVSQTVNNPNTGETLSARASIYLSTVRVIAANAGESLDLLMKAPAVESREVGQLAELDQNIAAQLIIGKQSLQTQLLKSDFAKPVSINLSTVAPANMIQKLSPAVRESQEVAASRRAKYFDKLLPYLNINDAAWQELEPKERTSILKNTFNLGASEKEGRLKSLSRAEKGIHGSEFVEPAVEQFIRKFAASHQGQNSSALKAQLMSEVRKLVFYTTLIHEMGHNFGLRHNFMSSSDSKNYTDKYFELEKKKQALAANDPQRQAIELEQESYNFSSVMDYTGGFNETMGGTGHYDDAAIRFAYNTSIDKNGDAITGVVRDYKFCTDHQVREDLLCQRFDKGANVSTTTANNIASYGRNYYFRNFRRDRLDFKFADYMDRIMNRTMLPMRQVADEFVYKMMTSKAVPAGENQCGAAFMRESIDAGEVANICDSSVVKQYASKYPIKGPSDFVYFLLKEGGGLKKDPKTYKPGGFADMIYANYLAAQFLIDVVGTPEPGLYFPMSNGQSYQLKPLPGGENEDARLKAFLISQGVDAAQVATLLPQVKGNVVELKPGPQAKYLMSKMEEDGSFDRVEVRGHLFDKTAALMVMGARSLPVRKYQQMSMNGNWYFYPQTKGFSVGLVNALVNGKASISALSVTTRSGSTVVASVPAALDLNTKYYGLITGLADFISDQDSSFSEKMRICNANDRNCKQDPLHKLASFKSSQGNDVFSAIQIDEESVAYELVSKGAEISKVRDAAFADIKNREALTEETKTKANGIGKSQKALMDLLAAKAPELAKKLSGVYGDEEQSLKILLLGAAKAVEKLDGQLAQSIPNIVKGSLGEAQLLIAQSLKDNEALLKEVRAASKAADDELMELATLVMRVAGSESIAKDAAEKLEPIENDAKLIRQFRSMLGIQ